MRAFEAFKETNDQRLDEIERRASADTLTSDKLDRINRALDDNKRIVDELALKSARPSLGGAPVRSGAALQHKVAFGPITLAAARNRPLRVSVEAYADIRRRRYRALAHFWRFGRGWLRRVDATLAQSSKSLAQSSQETKPMPDPQANFPNGFPSQESEGADTKWWGQSMTIWGALLTALSTVLPLLGPILGINLTVDLIDKLGQDIVLLIQAAGGLIGTIMTILGRMRATTLLERRPVKLKL